MMFLRFLLAFLFPVLAFADAVIFSGNDVKTLKFNIDLFGRSKILATNTDPSAGGGLAAPLASIATDYLTGDVWVKTGGSATAWSQVRVGLVDLTSEVTGVLPLANGGTNKNLTASAGAIAYTDADSLEVTSVGTSGQLLQSAGAGAPAWTTATYPSAVVGSDTFLRSNGTSWVESVATLANSYNDGELLFANGANTVEGLPTANVAALITDGSGVPSLSASSADGQVLRRSAGSLAFGAIDLADSDAVTGILPVANGGTGISSGTSGGVLGFTASGTIASSAALSANQLVIGGGAGATPTTLAAGTEHQVLRMGASSPSYGAVALNQSAAVTGSLAVANGGTGLSSGTSGGIPYFSSSSTIASSGALTANQLVIGGGAGGAPSVIAAGSVGSYLRINSSGLPAYGVYAQNTVSSATTLDGSYDYVAVSNSSAFSVTIPAASSYPGKVYVLTKTSSNFDIATIARSGSDIFFLGTGSTTSLTLNTLYESWAIVSNGSSGWIVLSHQTITPWTAFTPTLNSNTSVAGNQAWWRRVGDSIELRYATTYNGVGANSTYSATTPSGVTIDSAKLSIATTLGYGSAMWFDNGVGWFSGNVTLISSTSLSIQMNGSGSNFNTNTTANLDSISMNVTLPVSGWFN